ncbi:unnamed protein product [Phyllotreta striolata]|uniref:acid phosphatase n=1 Tax=Phyllotreta striolata TaxID=444603 RepID=A0A9N9TXA4_PHYSR|nr:unnamed protein product [Phyllotreta striolata]
MLTFKIALLAFAAATVDAGNENLIAVVQIYRHGQRTPVMFYNSDPYADLNIYWAGLDLGQLTNEGKRQHYALGQFTRNRYSDWLPKVYNKADIYVQSTDVDRTHMSAQANVYGLYPATGSQVWRKYVNWQPIPIHPSDPRVVTSSNSCPAYYELYAKLANEEEFINLDKQYSSLYQYVSEKTGLNVTTFSDLIQFYDALHIEEQVGYSLPSWTSSFYPEPLSTLAAKTYQSLSYNTPMKRLTTGVLLNEIIQYFELMATNPTAKPKYQMYSCHDTNVFPILNSIGQTPTKPLPFAVSLWFELRLVNSEPTVQLWMKSDGDFSRLSINGCSLDCPLSEVKAYWKELLLDVDGLDKECAVSSQ